MTLTYKPTTETGKGFLVPLFKAIHHLHTVVVASGYGWKLTNEQANAELDHALGHMIMAPAEEYVTTACYKALTDYSKQLTALQKKLQQRDTDNPEGLFATNNTELRDQLKILEQQSWALLSILDTELLGYNETDTDPGKKP